jgi:hypothetical protein
VVQLVWLTLVLELLMVVVVVVLALVVRVLVLVVLLLLVRVLVLDLELLMLLMLLETDSNAVPQCEGQRDLLAIFHVGIVVLAVELAGDHPRCHPLLLQDRPRTIKVCALSCCPARTKPTKLSSPR